MDIVKLVTSYLPSKKLLPWIVKPIALEFFEYFWANPNVFEAGIFSKSEIVTAPMHLIAGNPACAGYIASNWDVFKHCSQVWRNPGLWESLKPHLQEINRFIDFGLPNNSEGIDYHELAKNPHPEAIRYVQEIGIPLIPSNPGYVFKTTDFEVSEGAIIDTLRDSTWANPSAVPFLQQIVANKGHPKYAWLLENPHPWAIQELSKSSHGLLFLSSYMQDLCRNEGIFETVDFSELQLLLSRIGV